MISERGKFTKKIKSNSFFKSIPAFILVITLLLLSLKHVEAHDPPAAENKKITFLKNIGTTDEALSSYNSGQIDALYSSLFGQDVRFSGFHSEILEVKHSKRSTFFTSKLELFIGTYDLHYKGKITGIHVIAGYKWLKGPIVHMTDQLTFSWDNQTFYDDGFSAATHCTESGADFFLESFDAPGTAAANSLGWSTSLAEPQSGPADSHYGTAQIVLRPREPLDPSTVLHSSMQLEYAHQFFSLSINRNLSAEIKLSRDHYIYQSVSYTYR